MALIKCPACEAQISDRAAACVKCGNLLKKNTDNANMSVNQNIAVKPAVSVNTGVSAPTPAGRTEAGQSAASADAIVNARVNSNAEVQPKQQPVDSVSAPQSVNMSTQPPKAFYAGANTASKKNPPIGVIIAAGIGLICAAAAVVVFVVLPNSSKHQRLFDDGMAYLAKENYDEAIEYFSKAIKLKSGEAQYHYQRGVAYSEKKEEHKAIVDFTEAIRLKPDSASYYFSRASAYHSLKDYDRAIEDYTEAIRLDPNDARFHNSRGSAYRIKEEYDRAIADHTTAIRLNPNDERYHNNRGVAYLLKRDYDNAIINYTEAIRLAPDNARYYNNRGGAHNLKKDFFNAGADFAEAARLDPDNQEYSRNLNTALSNQTFTDRRDGQKYRMVRIGNLTWMAQNLNFAANGSWCYNNSSSNCVKYGRLYSAEAIRGACPQGWRLPNGKDLQSLAAAAGGRSMDDRCDEINCTMYFDAAGGKLKSKTGWNNSQSGADGNGTDDFGFSATPGGVAWGGFGSDPNFNGIGTSGSWWIADSDRSWDMRSGSDDLVYYTEGDPPNIFYIRCVQPAGSR